MICISQEKLIEKVKKQRKAKNLTQEQLCDITGMNQQMIDRIENYEYMPSISQLEKLAEVLCFNIPDLYVDNEPMIHTSLRFDNVSEREKKAINQLVDMMTAAKQQIILRKTKKG